MYCTFYVVLTNDEEARCYFTSTCKQGAKNINISYIPEDRETLEDRDVSGHGYNELKMKVLSLLSSEHGLKSKEVTARLTPILERNMTLRSVEMALLRYYRYGLLRRTGKRGSYVYELSDKGVRRLKWLRGMPAGESY